MRQGHNNNNKRMRGRNRKGPNPLARSYESNGPDVKIRGTALHIAEKYITLARDAASSGDRVAEQNYLQHAEHYYRIVAAAQAQMPQQPPMHRADDFDDEDEGDDRAPMGGYDRPMADNRQPQYGLSDPQPFVNGNGFNGHREAVEEAEGDDVDFDQAPAEGRPQGQAAERQGGGQQFGGGNPGGEQHFRQRGRRAGRGRRRPEGGQEFGQGQQPAQGQPQPPQPVPVAVTED
ncbi:MAG: DUF4167 domain-containing protein [Bauldia sp.]